MDNKDRNITPDGRQSPQDKAVQNPDQWKTGSEPLTEVQQANLGTAPQRENEERTDGEDDSAK